MLGTSTASENFSDEGETCVIFTSALFALFYSAAAACVGTGHVRKSLFS